MENLIEQEYEEFIQPEIPSFDYQGTHSEMDILQQVIMKNTAEYPQWRSKMQIWTWQQLLQRLRLINIHTTRREFEDLAEEAKSAMEVANQLLLKAPDSKKAIENMAVLWAACELLWQQFVPDWLNVEEMLNRGARYSLIEDESPTVLLDLFVKLLDDFIEELCMGEAQSYETISSWCTFNTTWFDDLMAYWFDTIHSNFQKNQGLHLATAQMVDRLENLIEGLPTKCAPFLHIQIYMSLINGNEDRVEAQVAAMESLFEPTQDFYEFLGDFYNNPPAYSYTLLDPTKAMIYYGKLLKQFDEA